MEEDNNLQEDRKIKIGLRVIIISAIIIALSTVGTAIYVMVR